jgi:glycerol kinase
LFINIGTTTEAVAHALQSRRNLRVMTNNLHVAMRLSRFCQFLADIIGVPVQRPAMLESTALGAAVLAGLATGLFASLEDSSAQRAQGRCFTPAMPAVQRKTLLAGWHAAVRLALPATNTQGTEQA